MYLGIGVGVLTSFIQSYRRIASKITGVDVPFVFGHGASDGRYFALKKIPTIVVGPVGGNWHGDNEWVDIKSLELVTKTVQQFLQELSV